MARTRKARKLAPIYVTSDWHLDASTAGVSRFGDVVAAISNMLGNVASDCPAAIIFAGDLCEDQPGRGVTSGAIHAAVAHACNVAKLLREAGILSVWLTGNHDVAEDGSGASTLDPIEGAGGLVVRAPALLNVAGWRVLALPFTASSHSYDPEQVATVLGASVDLVVGHLNVAGIGAGSETTDMPRGRDVFWPLETLGRLAPSALLIGGHYHCAQRFGASLSIVGAPVHFTFGEQNDPAPGYLVVPEPGTVRRVSYGYCRPLVTVTNAEIEAAQKPWNRWRDALVRVKYDGPPGGEHALAARLKGAGAAAVKFVPVAPTGAVAPLAPAARTQARRGRREAVLEAAGVLQSRDRAALLAHVERRMGEVGL